MDRAAFVRTLDEVTRAIREPAVEFRGPYTLTELYAQRDLHLREVLERALGVSSVTATKSATSEFTFKWDAFSGSASGFVVVMRRPHRTPRANPLKPRAPTQRPSRPQSPAPARFRAGAPWAPNFRPGRAAPSVPPEQPPQPVATDAELLRRARHVPARTAEGPLDLVLGVFARSARSGTCQRS